MEITVNDIIGKVEPDFQFFTKELEVKSTKSGKRIVRGFATTNDVDREYEVITKEAIEMAAEDLINSPTVFYEHRHSDYPVGKVTDAQVVDGKLLITVEISKTADKVWTLLQEGILRAFSIGGRFLETEPVMDKELGREINQITKMELFEVSIVGLPANPNALITSVSKAINKSLELKKRGEGQGVGGARQGDGGSRVCVCESCGTEVEHKKGIPCSKTKCPNCGAMMVGKSLETEETKSVIPYKDLGKAKETEKWDAGKEVKLASGDATKLNNMHAWVDKSDEKFNADERKWYKLPHHKGSGKQVAVWNGVKAAMGALLGARGGVDIPEADRKGVYNHLAEHYKEFDKTPPEFKSIDEIVDYYLNIESYKEENMGRKKKDTELEAVVEEAKSEEVVEEKAETTEPVLEPEVEEKKSEEKEIQAEAQEEEGKVEDKSKEKEEEEIEKSFEEKMLEGITQIVDSLAELKSLVTKSVSTEEEPEKKEEEEKSIKVKAQRKATVEDKKAEETEEEKLLKKIEGMSLSEIMDNEEVWNKLDDEMKETVKNLFFKQGI